MTRTIFILAAALLLPAGAMAQQLDMAHGGSIDITARDGIDWRQDEQTVIARGDAKAVRGDVTVLADTLTAWYRPKAGAQPASAPASSTTASSTTATGTTATGDTGGSEIYKVQALGNVRIYTATDIVVGDRAVYDMDQAVLTMTGRAMKLTTPTQVLTARDTLEYWSQKHMAVARGDAVAVTNDARRIAADTLVAYTAAGETPPGAKPAAAGTPPADPVGTSGKLEKMEAFGNVSLRTQTDTVTGDRGVYMPDTGMARIGGRIRITRGQNQLNGSEAIVNMKTGVARLISGEGGRVQGLVIPNDETNQTLTNGATKPPTAKAKP
ncbi:MAG: LptA/OstA family protein [Rhodospirillales bacterium]